MVQLATGRLRSIAETRSNRLPTSVLQPGPQRDRLAVFPAAQPVAVPLDLMVPARGSWGAAEDGGRTGSNEAARGGTPHPRQRTHTLEHGQEMG